VSQQQPDLSGTGAAYVRVSTDQQDTIRQYDAVRAFLERYGATIPDDRFYEDEGWARDAADRRPKFQALIGEVEAGRVQWIVVDALDRFGTKNSQQLIAYLYRLGEAGCRLYDAAGTNWAGQDIATIITAVVEGEKSKGEQTSKSHRVLGGKVARARLGQWQGGPPRFGMDVVCYARAATVKEERELWRVIVEGGDRRLRVYPNGQTERFDGPRVTYNTSPTTQVLRLGPSQEKGKLEAIVGVFRRYATESVPFATLAHGLNELGFRNSHGRLFQSSHMEALLGDPIYLGYYTWNKTHFGKFHRYKDGQTVPEPNYAEKGSRNAEADWVKSERLFDPIIDAATWAAVQRKLNRNKQRKAAKSASLYLSGLVTCAHCGAPMVGNRPPKPKGNTRW
jgi:DNA invertase Pin-like site-specific DNA recombinase